MDTAQQDRHWQARIATLLFAAAIPMGLPLSWVMVQLGQTAHMFEMAIHTVVATACFALLALRGAELKDRAYHLLLLVGSGLVTLGAAVDGPEMHPELFYLWPALYCAYFFSRRAAFLHIAAIGAMYAGALLVGPEAPTGPALWAQAMIVLAILVETVGRLRRRIDALIERLSEMARTDQLTGLANRRQFEVRLSEELVRARRTGRPLTVVLCDIDLFKLVNDEYGHAAGDETLRRVARALDSSSRAIDTTARVGGEEFALILPEADLEGAMQRAERVRADVSALTPVTISIGVAASPQDGVDAEALMREADRALYAAKAAGRDRIVAASGPEPVA